MRTNKSSDLEREMKNKTMLLSDCMVAVQPVLFKHRAAATQRLQMIVGSAQLRQVTWVEVSQRPNLFFFISNRA